LIFGCFTGAHRSGVTHGWFVCVGDVVVGGVVFGVYVSRALGCKDVEWVGGGIVMSAWVGTSGEVWA